MNPAYISTGLKKNSAPGGYHPLGQADSPLHERDTPPRHKGVRLSLSGRFGAWLGRGAGGMRKPGLSGRSTRLSGRFSRLSGWSARLSGWFSRLSGWSARLSGWFSRLSGWSARLSGRSTHLSGRFSPLSGRFTHPSGRSTHLSGRFRQPGKTLAKLIQGSILALKEAPG